MSELVEPGRVYRVAAKSVENRFDLCLLGLTGDEITESSALGGQFNGPRTLWFTPKDDAWSITVNTIQGTITVGSKRHTHEWVKAGF